MRVGSVLLRLLMILVFVFSILLIPLPRSAYASPEQDASYAVLLISPLVKVYEGQVVSMPYFLQEMGNSSLAPLAPGKTTVTANLGTAQVTSQGMSGTITYTAIKPGNETLTLTVDFGTGVGSGTGSTNFEVHPRSNYGLNFLLVNEASESLGGFRELLAGDGSFIKKSGLPIEGTGKLDATFILWAGMDQVFDCQMAPPVTGSTGFTIKGQSGTSTGKGAPPFTLDLNFQPINMNSSNVHCVGIGNLVFDYPWSEVQGGDLSALNFTGLKFPAGGGKIEINEGTMWGAIFAFRR